MRSWLTRDLIIYALHLYCGGLLISDLFLSSPLATGIFFETRVLPFRRLGQHISNNASDQQVSICLCSDTVAASLLAPLPYPTGCLSFFFSFPSLHPSSCPYTLHRATQGVKEGARGGL